MEFLTKQQISLGTEMLMKILDTLIDETNINEISTHLNALSSVQGNSSFLTASAKYHYLVGGRKDYEASALYELCESLNKSLHYKIVAMQSLLKVEANNYINSR